VATQAIPQTGVRIHTQADALPYTLNELIDRPQWVVWRFVQTPNRSKPSKKPFAPLAPDRPASTADPCTWSTYDQATSITNADGVGFVFTSGDPYFGIDLDDCVVSGQLHSVAQDVVTRLDTYTEISPSGTGVKAIGRGKLSLDRHRTTSTGWGGRFECYDQNQFFAITGKAIPGQQHLPVGERQDQLDLITREIFPSESIQEAAGASGGPSSGKGADYEVLIAQAEHMGGWEEVKDVAWFFARLARTQQAYMKAPRRQKQVPAHKPSRSEFEQSTITHLVMDGASDQQIRILADWGFGKQIGRRNPSYINTSIREARRWVFIERGLVTDSQGGWPRRPKKDVDAQYAALARGQQQSQWVAEVVTLGKSRRTAYYIRDRLVARGLVEVKGNKIWGVHHH
jgi:hypothetical protein